MFVLDLEKSSIMACLPPPSTCLYRQGLDLKVAIAKVGNDSWEMIARYLGFELYDLSNIPLQYSQKSDKLMYIIDKWCGQEGDKATLGQLLYACEDAGVSQNDIAMEYSKRMARASLRCT